MADNNDLILTGDASFDDIRAALSGDKPAEVKEPETPKTPEVPETPKENTPAATPEAPKTTETPEVPAEDKKPKRFSELSKKAREEKERADRLEAELQALRTAKPVDTPKPAPVAEAPGKPVEPDPAKYEKWEDLESARRQYTADLVAYEVNNALSKREQEAEQAKARERQQAIHQSWLEQVDSASEEHDNVDGAIKKVAAVVGKMGIADVIKESEVGVKIVLELDKDAALLKKIGSMSIASAAREIGKIEARIQGQTAQAQATPAATPKKLPDPPVSVGGGASSETGKPRKVEDMSIDEIRKLGTKEGWFRGR